MRVKFLQTADPVRYLQMLEASAPSTRAYCMLNGFEYETYVGVKYGRRPEHATFNRIALLNDQIDAGFDGWLVYLDADSFVVDLAFDLSTYLAHHKSRALILRPSIPHRTGTWRINAGVFLVNAAHPAAISLMRSWRRVMHWSVRAGQLAVPFRHSLIDDQKLLQFCLACSRETRHAIHYEDPALINGADASFIAQFLSSDVPDLQMRVAMIAARVDRAFAEASIDPSRYRSEMSDRVYTGAAGLGASGLK